MKTRYQPALPRIDSRRELINPPASGRRAGRVAGVRVIFERVTLVLNGGIAINRRRAPAI